MAITDDHSFWVIPVRGVGINISDPRCALEEMALLRESGGRHYVCFLEAHTLHWSYHHKKEAREILNGASLCYPDGIAVAKLASWRLGRPVCRVTGPTTLLSACEYGVSREWRHYLYGGKQGVAEELKRRLESQFPGVQIVGTCSPPFREPTQEEIDLLAQELQEKKVDFLWVALGGPKQEKWMHRYVGHLPVPVMLGVGAAFDFHTGRQSWAPPWMQRWGLEWLWRLCTGGARIFRRNILCVSHIALRLTQAFFGRLQYLFHQHPTPQRRLPAPPKKRGNLES